MSCFVHALPGVEASAASVDFSMPTLRDRLPGWMLSAYKHVQTTDAVRQGWRKSGLLAAWDAEKRQAALRHHATHPLFKQGFTYMPAAEEPLNAVMAACDINDNDEEEFEEKEEEEERE